jgi:hypothetical protein
MAVSKDQVFLMQGQYITVVDGENSINPVIHQNVVVASSVDSAIELLSDQLPSFKVIGHATLEDYENTASKLRATLKGTNKEWPLITEPKLVQ